MESGFRDMVVEKCVDIFFPRFCAGCGQEGSVWCQGCEQALLLPAPDPACPFCHTPGSDRTCASCREQTFVDGLTTMSSYAFPALRDVLTTWKYHGDEACAVVLERWVRSAAPRLRIPPGMNAVTHVPLHPARARQRGFDQGQRIAEMISHVINLPRKDLLARRRRTASQAGVVSSSRLVGDMDGVFEAHDVPLRVLLCDDVFTSGATMDAAAKCLKEAGAMEVWGFALARSKP